MAISADNKEVKKKRPPGGGLCKKQNFRTPGRLKRNDGDLSGVGLGQAQALVADFDQHGFTTADYPDLHAPHQAHFLQADMAAIFNAMHRRIHAFTKISQAGGQLYVFPGTHGVFLKPLEWIEL
jgi:hypothetical protein